VILLIEEKYADNDFSRYARDSINLPIHKDDFTVVIPVLNEEEAIEMVLNNVKNAGYYNILVVDGHSTDNTVQVVLDNNIKLVFQDGPGKTGAINTAINEVVTPYFVLMDGDCTYDPSDIDNLLDHMMENDQVIGARTSGALNIPLLNRLGNYIINNTFNLIFGTSLTDVCSGMYALRTNFAKKMNLKTRGFDVEVEVAAYSANEGKIDQVPIRYYSRVGEKKLSPLKDGIKIIYTVWRLSRLYNPVLLLSILGALLMLASFSVLGYVAVDWFNGVWHDGLALLGSTLFLVSIIMHTISIISLLLRRSERRILKKIKK
jgi:dolichol-phosphate mannosyltransferase